MINLPCKNQLIHPTEKPYPQLLWKSGRLVLEATLGESGYDEKQTAFKVYQVDFESTIDLCTF